jgi:signal transduction histidine kinase
MGWSALGLIAVTAIAARQLYVTRPEYGLPYRAQFLPDALDGWTALGGTWEVVDGAMRNDSNDRGSKILTGSSHWKNYVVEGDAQLLGEGSVGLLGRVSEAEVGENSFKGYFAGIRSVDNSLVLGAYDFAYHEAARVVLPNPVRAFHWYHIELKADGCQITASLWTTELGEVKTAPLNDPDCFGSGNIGLRSNGTGGVWRNVAVSPMGAEPSARNVPALDSAWDTSRGEFPAPPPQPISSLVFVSPLSAPIVSVRGSVVLTRPAIFVQDAAGGGVEIEPELNLPLKMGDEVEVTGGVDLNEFSPVIRRARVRLLREDVPASPMALTANQVASGQYDGRFVQLEGRLRGIAPERAGGLTMEIDSGTQSFHALLPKGRSRSHLEHLSLESRLRLRGVSVVDPRFNRQVDPFALLVRSAEDVDVVAGPPWWRPSTLILAALVVLVLSFTLNYLYLWIKHWRLRAVAEEREWLAHEIHDTLAQSFAGIGFQLQAIRNSMPPDAAALERQVEVAMLMTRTSHEEARRSIASLRPRSIGQAGLLQALRECAEKMIRNGKVAVEAREEGAGSGVPQRVKDTLYGIGQEAIANSIRHASPRRIRIELERQGTSICLSIEDDGNGFATDSDCAGFGLQGMRRKAESISASLAVTSKPGAGTRVEVKAAMGSRFHMTQGPRRAGH